MASTQRCRQSRLVAPRPAELDAIDAAAIPLAGATALQLLDRLDPPPGEWLFVHGAAGGVGSLLVQGRTLERLATAVSAGSLRAVVDEVVDFESASLAHRRVETGHGQGKVVLSGFQPSMGAG